MLEKVRFLPSTKECSKVEIVLVLVPALSYQAYCGYGPVFFHHEVSGGRGMAWLTFFTFRPCTRVKMRVTLDASVQ